MEGAFTCSGLSIACFEICSRRDADADAAAAEGCWSERDSGFLVYVGKGGFAEPEPAVVGVDPLGRVMLDMRGSKNEPGTGLVVASTAALFAGWRNPC